MIDGLLLADGSSWGSALTPRAGRHPLTDAPRIAQTPSNKSARKALSGFDTYHFSRRTDQTGCQHSYVPNARAEIQHALTSGNACFTK
jgi:hypothetical protein